MLLVLHELGPLEPLIDRAVVLRDGCVMHDGPPRRPSDSTRCPVTTTYTRTRLTTPNRSGRDC